MLKGSSQSVHNLAFSRPVGLTATLPLTQHSAAGRVAWEVLRWALPVSVAPTMGIPFGFFSSAY